MAKKEQGKVNETKIDAFESLKALYYSGKIKPALNKILLALQSDPKNLDLTLLACQCLVRTKDFDTLAKFANAAIKLNSKNPEGYYYKGVALHHSKGKEQEALKNFNEALALDPENVVYLKDKATTHLALFTDYHLPINIAEKHHDKGEESLLKIVSLIEQKANPSYLEYLIIGDVSIMIKRNMDAKKYYIKAVKAYDKSDPSDQNKNVYKDIIKSQKACIKLIEKFTE